MTSELEQPKPKDKPHRLRQIVVITALLAIVSILGISSFVSIQQVYKSIEFLSSRDLEVLSKLDSNDPISRRLLISVAASDGSNHEIMIAGERLASTSQDFSKATALNFLSHPNSLLKLKALRQLVRQKVDLSQINHDECVPSDSAEIMRYLTLLAQRHPEIAYSTAKQIMMTKTASGNDIHCLPWLVKHANRDKTSLRWLINTLKAKKQYELSVYFIFNFPESSLAEIESWTEPLIAVEPQKKRKMALQLCRSALMLRSVDKLSPATATRIKASHLSLFMRCLKEFHDPIDAQNQYLSADDYFWTESLHDAIQISVGELETASPATLRKYLLASAKYNTVCQRTGIAWPGLDITKAAVKGKLNFNDADQIINNVKPFYKYEFLRWYSAAPNTQNYVGRTSLRIYNEIKALADKQELERYYWQFDTAVNAIADFLDYYQDLDSVLESLPEAEFLDKINDQWARRRIQFSAQAVRDQIAALKQKRANSKKNRSRKTNK